MITNLIALASKKIAEQQTIKEREAKVKAIKEKATLFKTNGLLIKAVPASYPRGSKDILIKTYKEYTPCYPQFKQTGKSWNAPTGSLSFNNLGFAFVFRFNQSEIISVTHKGDYVYVLVKGLTKGSQMVRDYAKEEKRNAA